MVDDVILSLNLTDDIFFKDCGQLANEVLDTIKKNKFIIGLLPKRCFVLS